jgi:hypothetical protein
MTTSAKPLGHVVATVERAHRHDSVLRAQRSTDGFVEGYYYDLLWPDAFVGGLLAALVDGAAWIGTQSFDVRTDEAT